MTQSYLIEQTQAYIEAVNRGDWDAAVQFLSPEVLLVDYSFGGAHRGREAWVSLPTGETMPPTGRSVEVHFAAVLEADNDQRVAVAHFYSNPMELLTQLGMTTATSSGRR